MSRPVDEIPLERSRQFDLVEACEASLGRLALVSGEFSSKEEVDERYEGSYYDYVRRG